ncbi:hypothetical protein L7F22_026987 [Adiantum nelumboides]|nr:hypothetical protein [Adiantum nelumboides]
MQSLQPFLRRGSNEFKRLDQFRAWICSSILHGGFQGFVCFMRSTYDVIKKVQLWPWLAYTSIKLLLRLVHTINKIPRLIHNTNRLSSDGGPWQELQRVFVKRFGEVITSEEARAKLKAVRQDVSKDFSIFSLNSMKHVGSNWIAIGVRSNQYLKLSKLLECLHLHPRIREKVEDDADTYEDTIYLAKVTSQKIKRKIKLGMLNPSDYVPIAAVAQCSLVRPKAFSMVQDTEPIKVRPMADYVSWRNPVCDVHVPRMEELINEEEFHIEVNQEEKMVADVGVPIDLEAELVYGADDDEDRSSSCCETSKDKRVDESTSYGKKTEPDEPELVKVKEIKPVLVESLHERVAECSQVADTKDLEAELVYCVDDDEDTNSSSCETSKEVRADKSTSNGKETEPDKPEMVKSRPTDDDKQVKLVCGAVVVAMLMKATVECAIVVQQVQSFAKKNRVAIPMDEDKDDVIENKFLSFLVEYDAMKEQLLEE